MREVWKDIPGYEGLYQASNLGKIRSLYNYRKYNVLTPRIKRGYYQIGLRKNGVRKWHQVHRLVANTFISNENNLPQVNHKDENRLNNCVDNLEWCTASYNNCYGNRIEKVKSKTSKPICQYDLKGNFIKEYPSISCVERELKINKSSVSLCANGIYRKANGFIWKFKEVGGANVY